LDEIESNTELTSGIITNVITRKLRKRNELKENK
jgi:hypothetical protein